MKRLGLVGCAQREVVISERETGVLARAHRFGQFRYFDARADVEVRILIITKEVIEIAAVPTLNVEVFRHALDCNSRYSGARASCPHSSSRRAFSLRFLEYQAHQPRRH